MLPMPIDEQGVLHSEDELVASQLPPHHNQFNLARQHQQLTRSTRSRSPSSAAAAQHQHHQISPWVLLRNPDQGLLVTFDPISHKIELSRGGAGGGDSRYGPVEPYLGPEVDYCPLCGQAIPPLHPMGPGERGSGQDQHVDPAESASVSGVAPYHGSVAGPASMSGGVIPVGNASGVSLPTPAGGGDHDGAGTAEPPVPMGGGGRTRSVSSSPSTASGAAAGGGLLNRGAGVMVGGGPSSSSNNINTGGAAAGASHAAHSMLQNNEFRNGHRERQNSAGRGSLTPRTGPLGSRRAPSLSRGRGGGPHPHLPRTALMRQPSGIGGNRAGAVLPDQHYMASNYFDILTAVHEEELEDEMGDNDFDPSDPGAAFSRLLHPGTGPAGAGVLMNKPLPGKTLPALPLLGDPGEAEGAIVAGGDPVPLGNAADEQDDNDVPMLDRSMKDVSMDALSASRENNLLAFSEHLRRAGDENGDHEGKPNPKPLGQRGNSSGNLLHKAESIPTFDTTPAVDDDGLGDEEAMVFEYTAGPQLVMSQSQSSQPHQRGQAPGSGATMFFDPAAAQNITQHAPQPHQPASSSHDPPPPQPQAQSSTSSSHHLPCGLLNDGYYERFFFEAHSLGTGSFGHVFHCRHLIDGECLGDFAVKKVAVGDDRAWLRKIIREVKAFERLNHPNIVQYKHSWLESWQPNPWCPRVPFLFILMQYCNRGSLQQLIDTWVERNERDRREECKKHSSARKVRGSSASSSSMDGYFPSRSDGAARAGDAHAASSKKASSMKAASESKADASATNTAGGLPLPLVWPLLEDILSGIQYLHSQGVLHRDLKCENVLLTSDDRSYPTTRALLSDFGTAEWKARGEQQQQQQHHETAGRGVGTRTGGGRRFEESQSQSPARREADQMQQNQKHRGEDYMDLAASSSPHLIVAAAPILGDASMPSESDRLVNASGVLVQQPHDSHVDGEHQRRARVSAAAPGIPIPPTGGAASSGRAASNRYATNSSNFGTTEYMAPELFEAEQDEDQDLWELHAEYYDEKSDMWSLGIIAFNMAFGRLPFLGKSPFFTRKLIEEFSEKTRADLRGRYASQRLLPPSDGEGSSLMVQGLILALLQPDPWRRPSAAQLLRNVRQATMNFGAPGGGGSGGGAASEAAMRASMSKKRCLMPLPGVGAGGTEQGSGSGGDLGGQTRSAAADEGGILVETISAEGSMMEELASASGVEENNRDTGGTTEQHKEVSAPLGNE